MKRRPEHPSPPAGYAVRPFRPAGWLPGAHAQTVGGKLLRPEPEIDFRRERLDTPDGDFLDLDLTPPLHDSAPMALVLHGLEGSARRAYALLTYRALRRRGIRAVGMNFRSCSGEPNRTARFYHSGETGDIERVLRHLAGRFPGVPMGAIGFSLGGNVLLKFLGEQGEAARDLVQAAAAVSVPFDLAAGADALAESRLMGRIYLTYFLRSLLAKAEAKLHLLEDRIDLDALRSARTFHDFDDAATAPLHGFEDAADYYRRSSSKPFLEHIRVPTLLLQSADDPFLPEEHLPREAVARNPWLVAEFTARGGHLGFVEGAPWSPRFWAEEEAGRFLGEVLTGGMP